jgi:hypothetical protein
LVGGEERKQAIQKSDRGAQKFDNQNFQGKTNFTFGEENQDHLYGPILVLEHQVIHRKIIEHQLKVELKIPESKLIFAVDGEEALNLVKTNVTTSKDSQEKNS